MENIETGRESGTVSAVTEIVNCTLNRNDLPYYFGDKSTPDLRDIILCIREKYPNPHQRVLVQTDMTLPVKDLLEQLIYIRGVNDEKIKEFRGLGATVFLPVRITDKSMEDPDFFIYDRITEFIQVYGVTSFEILVYGDNQEQLAKVWEWVQTSADIHYKVIFPPIITKQLKLFENGIDIAPYAKRMKQAEHRNTLTTEFLRGLMDELREKVRSGKTAIQNFEETRSLFSKWLTMCLIQEFDLSPVYLSSYINEYVDLQVAYPFEKLSMFERLNFVSSLPADVGYIGKNQEFRCLFHIIKKIYPYPTVAFDLATGEVITAGLDQFDMQELQISDYRVRFTGSRNYFSINEGGIVAADNSDRATDQKLGQVFIRMMKAANIEDDCMTVRNTIMAKFHGKSYILYYNEPLGLVGSLQSEYFGGHAMVVQEEEFRNLIDAKIILALRRKESARDIVTGNSQFTEIMVRAANTFKPAIPIFVLMCCTLATQYGSELSYYDKRLRCDRCIVPIITHADSKLKSGNTILDYITLENLAADPIASGTISCFGTIMSNTGAATTLPVSIEAFRGCKLL